MPIAQAAAPTVYYSFEQPGATYIADNAGTHTLTLTGSPVVGNSGGGPAGATLKLNGTSQYASVTDSATLSPTGAMSLELAFKITALASSTDQALAGKWDENAKRSFRLYLDVDNGTRAFPVFEVSANGAATTAVTGDHALIPGVWYTLAGTYATDSSGTINLFVNGAQAATAVTSAAASLHDNASDFVIGATKNDASYSSYFNGFVDEVRLYGSARSNGDIAYSFDKGRPPVRLKFDEGANAASANRGGLADFGFRYAYLANADTASAWVTGPQGYAAVLDGTNDYVDIGTAYGAQFGPGVTAALHIKPAALGTAALVSRTDNGGYQLGLTAGGELTFGDRDGTPNVTTSGAGVTAGVWQHVAVAYDGTTANFFVDGRFIGGSAVALSRSNGSVLLGSAGGSAFFNGSVDDAAIYPYARSVAQIAVDRNHGSAARLGGSDRLTRFASGVACPSGYIPVPGDPRYGTADFCVMKYEAKSGTVSTAAGAPVVSITQTNAIAACAALGDNYHLISNNEWMTIARNAESVAANWTGGSVGSGLLKRGNVGITDAASYNGADPESGTGRDEKAKLTLSNGEEIWDLSGNVWEWTNDAITCAGTNCTTNEMPFDASPASEWIEFTAISTYGSLTYDAIRPSNATWDANYGVGRLYTDANAAAPSGTVHAFLRGGAWGNGAGAGAFTLSLGNAPSGSNTGIGFRCSFAPPQ